MPFYTTFIIVVYL